METAGAHDTLAEPRQTGSGFPELTSLGKRIEMLRIERGLSKQLLARGAGTSRQQLWRVMTGKSELTGTLGQRLAEVLQVDLRVLRGLEHAGESTSWTSSALSTPSVTLSLGPATLGDFLADPVHLQRALGALPADDHGDALRSTLLDAIADAAVRANVTLPAFVRELRPVAA